MSDPNERTSRRALLSGGFAALAGAALGAVGRAGAVRGATGDKVILGAVNRADQTTTINVGDSGVPALRANSRSSIAVLATTSSAAAILGESKTGQGVVGTSYGGHGVSAHAETGIGLLASATDGTAVKVQAGLGYAMDVFGPVHLSTSGQAVIPAGKHSVRIHPFVDLWLGSFVLLTPRSNLEGRDLWFKTDISHDTFTIWISSARDRDTTISWLLLG